MAKTKKKKAPKTKARAKVPKLIVKIKPTRGARQDVESAIAEKLGTQPTDLFTKHHKVIIECEQIGWKRHPGGK